MKIPDILKKLRDGQEGSIALILALGMSVLIAFSGFAIDLGREVVKASGLQNALDSAALAAVRELPADSQSSAGWESAVASVDQYLGLNNINNPNSVEYEPIYKNGVCGEIIGIKITAAVSINNTFTRIFGYDTTEITRSAEACLETVSCMSGIVPLCVTEDAMNGIVPGQTTVLKFGSPDDEEDSDGYFVASGWFGIVMLDGTGAAQYVDDFINGCSEDYGEGDILDMQTGNLSGPTEEAFDERIAGHYNCTYESHEDDCPRLVIIPVVTVIDNKQVVIKGFATFFLESVAGNGNDSIVTAKYVESKIISGTAKSGYSLDYGVYVAKLTA